MQKDLIKKLQPWVTTFSEAIKLQCKHGDEICVGGEILSIFDVSDMTNSEETMVQIEIDDNVGISTILIPKMIYKRYSLKVGDIILATGKLYDPDRILKKNSVATIICWNIELLETKEIT